MLKKVKVPVCSMVILVVCAILLLFVYKKTVHITKTFDLYCSDTFDADEAENVTKPVELSTVLKRGCFGDAEISGSITLGERVYQFKNDDVLQGKEISEGIYGYTIHAAAFYVDDNGQDSFDFMYCDVSEDFESFFFCNSDYGSFIGPAETLEEARGLYNEYALESPKEYHGRQGVDD